mmetsp:Transcript_49807/g.132133  ORF Transcript_49807/g.132133 Transcript_49807/m.132133 type:complete len:224 (+) Transcript_49807:178-849(+)
MVPFVRLTLYLHGDSSTASQRTNCSRQCSGTCSLRVATGASCDLQFLPMTVAMSRSGSFPNGVTANDLETPSGMLTAIGRQRNHQCQSRSDLYRRGQRPRQFHRRRGHRVVRLQSRVTRGRLRRHLQHPRLLQHLLGGTRVMGRSASGLGRVAPRSRGRRTVQPSRQLICALPIVKLGREGCPRHRLRGRRRSCQRWRRTKWLSNSSQRPVMREASNDGSLGC